MAQDDEMSALFPIFALSILALLTIPWTINRIVRWSSTAKAKGLRCQCSLCEKSPKNRPSLISQGSKFLSLSNTLLLLLWISMAGLLYYIHISSKEVQPFEPFSILGLEIGASEADIKKAYRKLSLQYHPDKNPDPAANEYFVNFISKAYQALTDEAARLNLEKYGHPDGQQSVNVGIALPKFLLEIQGSRGAILLLGLVSCGILLPLVIVVIYLSRSAKYTGNNIMQDTLAFYYHSIKPSLAPSKVLEVFSRAAEFFEMKLRGSDVDPLQKLFTLVRSELNLDPKNLKQETTKYWKKHPATIKAELLFLAQMCRMSDAVPRPLQNDFSYVLRLAPRLLEELMKMALFPRTSDGHGWLRPAIGVMELSQCIMQAVPVSARKVSDRAAATGPSDGAAGLLQLPHVDESTLKKLARKKVRSLQELRELPEEERLDLLSAAGGLSQNQVSDVKSTLDMMPDVSLEAACLTLGEEGIEEGDVLTFRVWLTMRRGNGLVAAYPHTPHYPFPKEEAFWLLLVDPANNSVWVSQRVSFMEEITAVRAAADYTRETAEGEGDDDAAVNAKVQEAMARVRTGARLAISKFAAPGEGVYNLTVLLMSDVWIGCDKRIPMKLKIFKRSRAGTRVSVAEDASGDGEVDVDKDGDEEEEDEGEEEIDEDYESEYSEDDEEGADEEDEQGHGARENGVGEQAKKES